MQVERERASAASANDLAPGQCTRFAPAPRLTSRTRAPIVDFGGWVVVLAEVGAEGRVLGRAFSHLGIRMRVLAGLTLVGALALLAPVAASADPPKSSIVGTIQGTVVPVDPGNPSGPVTVYVQGQWNWTNN